MVADGPERGTAIGLAGQVTPAVADARGLPRQDRVFVAELNLDRLWRARVVAERRDAAAAAPSVRRPRSLDRRLGCLACGDHSWHHSGGRPRRAGAARLGHLLRSLSGQGRAGRRGQRLGAADVPGGGSHVDRRRSAAERRHDSGGARPRALAPCNDNEDGMSKTATRSVELEPIDRLEEKMKLLVEHGRAHEGRTGARRGGEPAAVARARRGAGAPRRKRRARRRSCRR